MGPRVPTMDACLELLGAVEIIEFGAKQARAAVTEFMRHIGACQSAIKQHARTGASQREIAHIVQEHIDDLPRVLALLRDSPHAKCLCRNPECPWKPEDYIAKRLREKPVWLLPEKEGEPSLVCLPVELLVLIMRYVAPDFKAMLAARLTCHALRLVVDAAVPAAFHDCYFICYDDEKDLFVSQLTHFPSMPERGTFRTYPCSRPVRWILERPSRALCLVADEDVLDDIYEAQWGEFDGRIMDLYYPFPTRKASDPVFAALGVIDRAESRYGKLPLETRNRDGSFDEVVRRAALLEIVMSIEPSIVAEIWRANDTHPRLFKVDDGRCRFLVDLARGIIEGPRVEEQLLPPNASLLLGFLVLRIRSAVTTFDLLNARYRTTTQALGASFNLGLDCSEATVERYYFTAFRARSTKILSDETVAVLEGLWFPDDVLITTVATTLAGRGLLRTIWDDISQPGDLRARADIAKYQYRLPLESEAAIALGTQEHT